MNGPGMGFTRAEEGWEEEEYDSITSASLDLRVLGAICSIHAPARTEPPSITWSPVGRCQRPLPGGPESDTGNFSGSEEKA